MQNTANKNGSVYLAPETQAMLDELKASRSMALRVLVKDLHDRLQGKPGLAASQLLELMQQDGRSRSLKHGKPTYEGWPSPLAD